MAKGLTYNEVYYKGSLDDETAKKLLHIRKQDDIMRLRHCIYDIPIEKILEVRNKVKELEKKAKSPVDLSDIWGDYKKPVGRLKPYQTVGVAFFFCAKSGLLGDEVGLGKTVQIAGLVNVCAESKRKRGGSTYRYVFLTEKTSVPQIRDKMMQFTGEYVGALNSGGEVDVRKFIELNSPNMNYSIVGPHSLLKSEAFAAYCREQKIDLMIVDESSVLKSRTSQIYKDTKMIRKMVKDMIMLNATPIEDGAENIYNQFNIIDDKFMPTVAEFQRNFCKMVPRFGGRMGFEVGGYKNTEYFREAISLRYLARTRDGLGAEYKDNESKTYIIPLSDVQSELMKRTTLYQMVADYPTGVDSKIEFNEFTCSKLGCLLDVMDNLNVEEDKALIYCKWKECQLEVKKRVEQMGYSVLILNGDTSMTQRDIMVRKFNEGLYDVIITNVQRGLDIKNCNNCIMYTIDPNPQKMIQFEGRITRAFDVIGKNVIMLVSEGKERKTLEQVLKMRLNTSNKMLNQGKSLLNKQILEGENVEVWRE